MSVLPFSCCRAFAPLLAPLRWLARRAWLREADVDAVLNALHPGLRLNRIFARVEGRRWVADDMLELSLRTNGNWRGGRPGQHVQVYLERDGVRLSRSYSLTAVEAGGRLRLAVRHQPGGRVSPQLLHHLAVGAVIELSQASGDLDWPEAADSVLLLAAGSGLTPLLGLLREALERGFRAPVTLLHYVRERGQRAFVEELEELQRRYGNFRVRWAVTSLSPRPSPRNGRGEELQGASLLHGRLHADHLGNLPASAVLACGPAGFVDSARQLLPDIASWQAEAFTPPRWPATSEPRVVHLRFANSAREHRGDNQRSLLDQAESAGLRPAHGCRQGICASCTCTLLAGSVRDLRSGAVLAEPNQPIRLCVSAPLGDLTLDL